MSCIESIEYLVSDRGLSQEEVQSASGWSTGTSLTLNPERKCVVYAKLTDKAKNTAYLSSDGMLFVVTPSGYVTDIETDSAKLNMLLSDTALAAAEKAGFEYRRQGAGNGNGNGDGNGAGNGNGDEDKGKYKDAEWTKTEEVSVTTNLISQKVEGLTAATDYEYRPYVVYAGGSTDIGSVKKFTTEAKPVVTGNIAVIVVNNADESKDVVVTIEEGNHALASQEYDGIAAGQEVTTGKFKELPDGTYNIVIRTKDGLYEETQMITIADGASETTTFVITKGEVKTEVRVEEDTPKIAAGGLPEIINDSDIVSQEEQKQVEEGAISLDITLFAENLKEEDFAESNLEGLTEEEKQKKEEKKREVDAIRELAEKLLQEAQESQNPENDAAQGSDSQGTGSENAGSANPAEPKNTGKNAKAAVKMGLLLDLSLFKTTTQLTGEHAGRTDIVNIGASNTNVLEIAVPYHTEAKGLMVLRYHGGTASALTKLAEKPAKGSEKDGQFYLSEKYIHIFASGFSTYAVMEQDEELKPGTEEPAEENTEIQEPTTETTGTEEPSTEESASENTGTEEPATEEPSSENTGIQEPTTETTEVKEPTTETTGTEEPATEELASENTESTEDSETTTPGKTTPKRPAKPTLKSKTQTTITVVTVSGQLYSIDGGKTWQKKGTFTGLTPSTRYSIITKTAATKTANESPVSKALTVTTEKKTAAETVDQVTKTEKAAAKIALDAGLKVSQTGSKVTVEWGKVKNADRYEVYAAYCGKDKCKLVKTVKDNTTTEISFKKLNGKKLNLRKNIKVYVVAYRSVNGKRTKLARSIGAHITGSKNTKYTNVRKITLTKSSVSLKSKQTAKIGASVVLVNKKLAQLPDGHAPQFRYASTNKKVATVTSGGRIKAVGKGTCYVYVYAKNGYAKRVKVSVGNA